MPQNQNCSTRRRVRDNIPPNQGRSGTVHLGKQLEQEMQGGTHVYRELANLGEAATAFCRVAVPRDDGARLWGRPPARLKDARWTILGGTTRHQRGSSIL